MLHKNPPFANVYSLYTLIPSNMISHWMYQYVGHTVLPKCHRMWQVTRFGQGQLMIILFLFLSPQKVIGWFVYIPPTLPNSHTFWKKYLWPDHSGCLSLSYIMHANSVFVVDWTICQHPAFSNVIVIFTPFFCNQFDFSIWVDNRCSYTSTPFKLQVHICTYESKPFNTIEPSSQAPRDQPAIYLSTQP